ncbi:uncharacterized protein LOC141617274 [Silene latifolia]|uniref:uncharacterized protein LOC141617274 n=1 Tax=Silene latifolia TaxID=37657 RepID=UPI003D77FABF
MAQPTVEEQLNAALQQFAEMENLKENMAQSEAEILQLKESESALKQKLEKTQGSGSKIQPGTPFSSIIKHFDFSNFGSPSAKKVINTGDEETPKDDEEKPDETGAAIMMAVVQEIKKLHEKIEKIPGVPITMEEVDLPKKFVVPSMRTYDGTLDPQNHVAFNKQKMLAALIPSEYREVCMCKGFGTTLTGPALQWYINLPNGSIKSFANLINTFNQQFASSRELEKRSSNLYRITQKPDETLRAFLNRFNKEKVSIPRCDVGTPVEAKTLPYIRLEEDKSYKVGASSNTKDYEKTNRKSVGYNRGSSHRTTLYTRADHSEVNVTQEQQGLIRRLDSMGLVVRWPRKLDNPNPIRDQTKWCEFYMDVGHVTEDCFTLRKEVAYLLKVGYLKDLIRTKGSQSDQNRSNQEQKQKRNLPPPPPLYEVKFINDIPDLHHDGLVISMQIRTTNVRRILIDGGSSVNLIMLDILKAMKIKEDQITKKFSVLVGFNGETRNTLGEIYLPTYVKGVVSYERSGVLDCLSSYNVILGRPWIHNLKAVPSTYHQCVKIPTEWGIATIKGEHKSAQECYPEDLKPSKAVGSDAPDTIRPDLQKRRKFGPERNLIINEEVDKLLDMGMIKEVMYPEWLANVVVV